jgi:ABC-type Zn uptake system ZnuABC Zn-binding protein ZnuA
MIGVGMAFLVAVGGCRKAKDPWASVEGGNVKVLVSFPPLYCFTKAVADKDAKVQSLLTDIGPHEYSPTTGDAQVAAGANLFLINGLMIDDKLANLARGTKPVEVAEALPQKSLLSLGKADHGKEKQKDHKHEEGKDHDHEHGEWDPHVWLGIDQAILMVGIIRDELKKADPAHAADYEKRASDYTEKLKKLQEDGKKLLADKKNRKLIAMHDSLGYFCKSFDLQLVDSIMPQPGVEADLKKLADLAEECKKEDILILAVEPQYSKDRAKMLRDNLKGMKHQLEIVEIDPIETAPRDKLSSNYYLDVMRQNLENLAKHMQ